MRLLAAEPPSTAEFSFHFQRLWNDLVDPVSDGVGLVGFKSRAFVAALIVSVWESVVVNLLTLSLGKSTDFKSISNIVSLLWYF